MPTGETTWKKCAELSLGGVETKALYYFRVCYVQNRYNTVCIGHNY